MGPSLAPEGLGSARVIDQQDSFFQRDFANGRDRDTQNCARQAQRQSWRHGEEQLVVLAAIKRQAERVKTELLQFPRHSNFRNFFGPYPRPDAACLTNMRQIG